MGTWGTGVLESDDALDAYHGYADAYNRRAEAPPLPVSLLDASASWVGLAEAQWERKRLDPRVLAAVERIVAEDIDAELWGEAGLYEERKAVLVAFLDKIRTPPARAKRRQAPKLFRAPFTTGQALAWRREDGTWGAALCVGHSPGWQENAHATLLELRLHAPERPTAEALLDVPVLLDEAGVHITSRCVGRGYPAPEWLEVIGELQVDKVLGDGVYGYAFGWDLDRSAGVADAPSLRAFLSLPADPDERAMMEAIGRGNLGFTGWEEQVEAYRDAVSHWRLLGWELDDREPNALHAVKRYFGIHRERAQNRLFQTLASGR